MERLFGTDGLRAIAGQFPLDYASVCALGHALISLLDRENLPLSVIIGRDTRESGIWLEQALLQGIQERGGKAVSAGVIPTSAISYLTMNKSFSAGIVISASHNPYEDNGIKIFSSEGTKISNEWEEILERNIRLASREIKAKKTPVPASSFPFEDYFAFLKSRFNPERLPKKIKIVVDCSNGASSVVAPRLFSELGFRVKVLSNSPDGKNINSGCGSLHPQNLARKTAAENADMGIAYDGDADRAIWVDEKGRILNGDHTLFVLAKFMKEKGLLKSDTVVATTMSNMGLEIALKKLGIRLIRTQVGDKYVLDQMMKRNANLGGEQSGHTIFLDDCPTGDGILTSLKMLEVMAFKGVPLSALTTGFEEFPQILKNVPVSKKKDFKHFPEIMELVGTIEKKLDGCGRLNLRYSGTEPLARIMIEGKDSNSIEYYAALIAKAIEKNLGKKD